MKIYSPCLGFYYKIVRIFNFKKVWTVNNIKYRFEVFSVHLNTHAVILYSFTISYTSRVNLYGIDLWRSGSLILL